MSYYLHLKKFICKVLTCWLPYKQRILYREALYWFSIRDYIRFKHANYHIVSLGTNCLPRGLTTAIKLKPRRFYGEKTCVFDLSVNPDLKRIIYLIETDFADYFDNVEINEKTFPHDYDMSLIAFKERYQKRIQNFQDILQSDKMLYFIHSDYKKVPLKEYVQKLYDLLKSKRNGKPFTLILLTSEYLDIPEIIQFPEKFTLDDGGWLVYMINEYGDYHNKYTQYRERMDKKLKALFDN